MWYILLLLFILAALGKKNHPSNSLRR